MTAQAPRLDASSALLRELRSSADRGFTGSITARSGAHEVSVYLSDGDVYAVHSPQLPPPAGDAEPEQDRADQARTRDWAYGLIAAASTWQRAKVGRTRKKTTTEHTFAPTAWQVVLADVSARVDGVVTAWGTIVAALASAGIAKRPASLACTRLIVAAPEHELLTGETSIDQTALNHQTTRATVLREIAAVILAGGGEQLHFDIAPDPAEPALLLVPESLEDPAGEWGSVDHLDIEPAPAPLLAIEAAHPQDEDPITTSDPSSESEHDQYMDHYDAPSAAEQSPDVEPDAGYEPEAADQDGPEEQIEYEAEPVLEQEPQYEAVPAEPLTHQEVAPYDAEAVAQMNGADALRVWVGGAENSTDRDLREHIFTETVHSTARVARQKLQGLDAKVQEYERTLESLPRASEMVHTTRDQLEEAKRQYAEIEALIDQLVAQDERLVESAENAKAVASAAASSVQKARHAVEEAKLELARREQAASEAAVSEAQAIDRARKSVAAVTELRTGALKEATERLDANAQDVLGPAQRSYDAAKSVADDAHRDVLTARQSAQLAGREATQSVRIVAELDDGGLCDVSSLITQLQHLHARASQEVEGLDPQEVDGVEVQEDYETIEQAPEPLFEEAYAAPTLQQATYVDDTSAYQGEPAEDYAEQVQPGAETYEPQPWPAQEAHEQTYAAEALAAPAPVSDLDGLEDLEQADAAPSFDQIVGGGEDQGVDESDQGAPGAAWRPIHPAA